MIIDLTQSDLFKDPAIRFAKEHADIWNDIWRRYNDLYYSVPDLCDLYLIKTGKQINQKTIRRWLWRAEIYSKVKPVLESGARCVKSDFFGDEEFNVIKELTKNISSGHTNPKVLP